MQATLTDPTNTPFAKISRAGAFAEVFFNQRLIGTIKRQDGAYCLFGPSGIKMIDFPAMTKRPGFGGKIIEQENTLGNVLKDYYTRIDKSWLSKVFPAPKMNLEILKQRYVPVNITTPEGNVSAFKRETFDLSV